MTKDLTPLEKTLALLMGLPTDKLRYRETIKKAARVVRGLVRLEDLEDIGK